MASEENSPLGQGRHRRRRGEEQPKHELSRVTPRAGYECEIVKLPDHLQTECIQGRKHWLNCKCMLVMVRIVLVTMYVWPDY